MYRTTQRRSNLCKGRRAAAGELYIPQENWQFLSSFLRLFASIYIIQRVPKRTDTFQSFMIKKLDNIRKFFFISLKSVWSAIFSIIFSKTVNLNFNGLAVVNSLCSISRQEITKKGRFLSCPSELNVRSLRVVDQSQNLLGTALWIWETFNLSFKSIAFDIFCS